MEDYYYNLTLSNGESVTFASPKALSSEEIAKIKEEYEKNVKKTGGAVGITGRIVGETLGGVVSGTSETVTGLAREYSMLPRSVRMAFRILNPGTLSPIPAKREDLLGRVRTIEREFGGRGQALSEYSRELAPDSAIGKYGGMLGGTIGRLVPIVAAGAATGGLAAPVLAAGSQQFGGRSEQFEALEMDRLRRQFPDADDAELMPIAAGKAVGPAFISALKTAGITALGGVIAGRAGVWAETGLGRTAAQKTADIANQNVWRRMGGGALIEGTEEGLDAAIDVAIDRWKYNPELGHQSAAEQIATGFILGAIIGGGISGIGAKVEKGRAGREIKLAEEMETAELMRMQEDLAAALAPRIEARWLEQAGLSGVMPTGAFMRGGQRVIPEGARPDWLTEAHEAEVLDIGGKQALRKQVALGTLQQDIDEGYAAYLTRPDSKLTESDKRILRRVGEEAEVEMADIETGRREALDPEDRAILDAAGVETVEELYRKTVAEPEPVPTGGIEAATGIEQAVLAPTTRAEVFPPLTRQEGGEGIALAEQETSELDAIRQMEEQAVLKGEMPETFGPKQLTPEPIPTTDQALGLNLRKPAPTEVGAEQAPDFTGPSAIAGIPPDVAAPDPASRAAALGRVLKGEKEFVVEGEPTPDIMFGESELAPVEPDVASELDFLKGPPKRTDAEEKAHRKKLAGKVLSREEKGLLKEFEQKRKDWKAASKRKAEPVESKAADPALFAIPAMETTSREKALLRKLEDNPDALLSADELTTLESLQKKAGLPVEKPFKATKKALKKLRNAIRSWRRGRAGTSALPVDVLTAQMIESALNVAIKVLEVTGSVKKALDEAYASLGETSIGKGAFDSAMIGRLTSVIELMDDGTTYTDAVAATRAPLDGKVPFQIVEEEEAETAAIESGEVLPDETVKPDPYKLRWGKDTGSKLWKSIKRFFSYGMSDVAASNTMYGVLGKQMDNQVDNQDEYIAFLRTTLLESGAAPYLGASKAEKETANIEFAEYQRKLFDRASGDPLPSTEGYSEVGRGVIDGWKKVALYTGNEMVDAKVRVRLPNGKYRDFKMIGEDFWGRLMIPEYARALNSLTSETTELTTDLESLGKILKKAKEIDRVSVDNIRKWWWKETGKIGKGRGTTGDQDGNRAGAEQTAFFSGIDKARTKNKPLGEAMDFTLAAGEQWIYNWSRRMAQVNAYGQKTGGAKGQKDLFDTLLEKLNNSGFDSKTDEARFVMDARKGAYELTEGTTAEKAVNLSGKVATLTMLTGYFNAIRNLTGWGPTAAVFGMSNSFNGMKKLVEYADSAKQSRSWGTLQNNAELLLAGNDISGGPSSSLDVLVKKGLKYSLFTLAEDTVRIHAGFTASSFVTEGIGAVKSENNPELAAEFREMAERFDTDPDLLIKEDSPTGKETSKFIRRAVKEVQGGYRFNQLPAYMGTPMGRFMFKFGSYGLQMTRAIRRNALAPIAKDPTNLRSWKPLMLFIATAAANGELLYALRDLLFGKERPDKTLEEITKGDSPMADVFWRIVNNITYAGTLGIIGDLSGMARSVQTKRRVRNPLEPAGTAIASNTLVWLNNAVREKGLSEGAFEEFMRNQFSLWRYGMPAITKGAGLIAPEWDAVRLQKAEEDRNFLRNATRRFQEAVGDDVKNMIGAPTFARSPYTRYYSDVKDELMIGNVPEARDAAKKFAEALDPEDRDGAWARLSNSISASQPMKIGDARNKEIKMEFISWARRNLSEADVERVLKVQSTYMNTARNTGLISGGNERVLRSMKILMNLKAPKGRRGKKRDIIKETIGY